MARVALVVDDDRLSLELVTDLLTARGWEVRGAMSGEEALAMLDADPPQLLLLDLGLPRMSGRDVMRAVRSREATRRLPIIAVTAAAMQGDAETAIADGFDGYLTKPVDTRRLVDSVEEIVARVSSR